MRRQSLLSHYRKAGVSVRSMQFQGMTISAIDHDSNRAEILVDRAIIVKDMDGAEQDTRWHGKGRLTIDNLYQSPEQLPNFPITLSNADIRDNQMTYRGEISIPFEFHGNVGIVLHFSGDRSPLRFFGASMAFNLTEHEKYIEHI